MKRALYLLSNTKQILQCATLLVCAILGNAPNLSAQGQYFCEGQAFDEIVIDNLVLESGSDLGINAIYRQVNTYPGVDALVEILSISEGSYLDAIDYSGHGHDKAFQPILHKSDGNIAGYAEFKFYFVETGTNSTTTISHILYSAIDIDGESNNLREYVELSNVMAYTTDQATDLEVFDLSGSVKFIGPTYSEDLNEGNFKINATAHANNASGFIYKCGMSGNISDRSRHFALTFHCIGYNAPEIQVNVPGPTALCNDIEIGLDYNGLATLTPDQIDNNSYGEVSFVKELNLEIFDYTDIGVQQVELTIRDEYDQTSNCHGNVTVFNRDPDIICPPDITTNTNSGCYRSGLDLGQPVITSNVPIFSITNDAPDQFLVGVTIVTWTIIDVVAGITTCQQIITIVDDIAPTFVPCVDDVTVFADPDDCDFSTLLQAPVVSDNCGIASLTSNSDYPLNLGATSITWTVVDPSGLSTTCTQIVTVIDNTSPEIICPDIVTLENEDGACGVPGDLVPPTISDACGISTVTSDAPITFPVGSTDVTWTVTDNNGNVSECSQTIVVEDNESPEITCPEDIEVTTASTAAFVIVGQPVFSDDCGIGIISNSFNNTDNASGIYPLGTTAILWTVTDNNGNTSTCIMTVTVTDDTAPPITCPVNVSVNASTNGCDASVSIDIPSVEGGEVLASLINNYNGTGDASDTYPVGQTVVIWTATDVNGNVSTCSMLLIVEDTTPPTLFCPNDISLNATGGACDEISVDIGTPTVSDGCGVATIENNAPSAFTVGTTTVTWTVTDINGNSVTCDQSVTLIDNSGPEITCPADIIASADAGLPSAFVSIQLPNATDDCGIDSYVNDYNGTSNASDVYPIGVTTVVWTVTDNNGNSSSCSMTITIQDTEAPPINCPPNVDVNASSSECETSVTVDIPTVSDNQGIASIINDFNGTDNASGIYPIGTTVITWTATDLSGNQSQCTMTVTVSDVTDPTVECPDNLIINVDVNACVVSNVTLTPPVVSDACGISSVTNNAPAVYGVGVTTVIWTVTDSNGNETTCSQNLVVEDNAAPTINCPPNVSIDTDPGVAVAAVAVAQATANDDCGIDNIVNDYTGTNNASGVYPIGTTVVTWIATDVNGNNVSCSMTVTVNDGENPEVICPENPSIIAELGQCEAFVTVDIPLATDNNGIQSLINDFNGTNNASGIYQVGVTTVTWTATDFDGNTSSCVMTVTVLDETPPSINCQSDVNVNVDQDECVTVSVTLDSPSISDECGLNGSSIGSDAPNFFEVGVTTVTWTIADVNGNVSTCTQIITVEDNIAPSIECPDDITLSADEMATSTFVNIGIPAVSDNCEIESLINDFNNTGNASDVYELGVTIITWTVTDVNGLTASCTMTVNVIDSEAPPIECPENVDVNANADSCEAFAVVEVPTYSDNDGIASVVNDFNGTDNATGIYPIGTTIIIWTVTDNSGNSATCPMEVTVSDITPPAIDCSTPGDFIADDGICAATDVSFGGVNTNDACGIASLTNNAPDTFFVGVTAVIWTVTDNSGNTETCDINVTVLDTQSPIVICPENITVGTDSLLCEAAGVDLGIVIAEDNCGIVSVTNNGLDSYPLGSTTVTWTIEDENGNITTCDQIVNVVDDEDLTYIDPGDLTIEADLGLCFATGLILDEIITMDNCSGVVTVTNDLSDFMPLPVGTTTITWTIVDAAGNVTTFTQDIEVEDNQDPVITCPDDVTVENEFRECWAIVEIEIPEVSDNCDVFDILNDYNNTSNASDTFYVGVTEIVWTVTDVNSNSASCTQIITVLDAEDPSLACPPNVAVANDPGFCGAEVIVFEALASDNCEIDTLYNDYNNTGDASDYYPVGVTSVSWIAVDINGNEFSCDMNVTIVDTELPEIICPADIETNTDLGLCEANLTIPLPQVIDNCEVSFLNNFTNTDNASGVYSQGVTVVVWTATDPSENQATCSQSITVLDNEAPVIDCPGDIIISNSPGLCGAIVEYDPVTYSDNCGIEDVLITSGVNSGEYLPVGDTTITYVVTDLSNNVSMCSFNVVVNDVQPPQIICPANILIIDAATVVTYDDIIVVDNCEDYSLIQIAGLTSGSVFEHGTTVNTFVVDDVGGNSSGCSFTICVDLAPVASDDVVTVSVAGSEIEVEPLSNDFDPDGDDIEIIDYSVDFGELIVIDNEFFIYNAPEDWCGFATINYSVVDLQCGALTDDANILVYVNCPEELFIPEGISPDGDGVNDTFEVIGLWQYPNNQLTVFNRWGHEIFDMVGYDNSWDGTSKDKLTLGSNPLPRGTYFYLLDLGNGEEPIKGFVYVLNR
ncbi:MAG: gliding motility-associated-like protein [Patiriisocius sp.]|jgi:gliding motility-associated-like protein